MRELRRRRMRRVARRMTSEGLLICEKRNTADLICRLIIYNA